MITVTAGTKRILIGHRCELCNLFTNDPKAPRICPHHYHPMEPVYKYIPLGALEI